MPEIFLLIILKFSSVAPPPPQRFHTMALCQAALATLRADAARLGYMRGALVASCVRAQ